MCLAAIGRPKEYLGWGFSMNQGCSSDGQYLVVVTDSYGRMMNYCWKCNRLQEIVPKGDFYIEYFDRPYPLY